MKNMEVSYEIAHADQVIKPFVERGLLPANARRMVIDIEAGRPVKILYECFGDNRLVECLLDVSFGVTECKRGGDGHVNEEKQQELMDEHRRKQEERESR